MTTQEIVKEYKKLDYEIERGYRIICKYPKNSKNYITLKSSLKVLEKKLKKINNWFDAMEEGNGYELKL
ncbi:hypothetical protein N9166_00150 [bacterium]|nr:hypothetical protein [bacterium]